MRFAFCAFSLFCIVGCSNPPIDAIAAIAAVKPAVRTARVADDADDPAIWIHPDHPERSLIIGTNKAKAPTGALVVFGLDGSIHQTAAGLDRPNNVDIEYGLPSGDQSIDIAVTTERLQKQLRIFRIAADGSGIADITAPDATHVFTDRKSEEAAPMGISLYKRPSDGAVFAIVSPKSGPREGYLGQYRLQADAAGRVSAKFVRYFGRFSGKGEIEAVAVDDALGYVYYADEGDGIHKYHADPDHPDAAKELAHFGKSGFRGDREGIAIYTRNDGTGFLICTDQLPGSSEYHVFAREGAPGNPHDHTKTLRILSGGADSTDGLEITSRPMGPQFPQGMMVAMNSSGKNFFLFRWQDVAVSISGP